MTLSDLLIEVLLVVVALDEGVDHVKCRLIIIDRLSSSVLPPSLALVQRKTLFIMITQCVQSTLFLITFSVGFWRQHLHSL